MNLNKILFEDKDNFEYKGSRVHSLIRQNAIYKTQKLELKPFEISNTMIANLLDESGFNKLRKKLSKQLILKGLGALIAVPHNGSYYIAILDNVLYTSIGKHEIEVEGTTDSTYVHDNTSYPIRIRAKYVEGKPLLQRYVVIETEEGIDEVQIMEDFYYPSTTLPVEVFVNNEDELSDVDYFGVVGSLERLNYMDGQLRGEFELSKTMPYFNNNFTDAEPAEETAELRAGRGYMEENSYAAKIREGQIMLPSNGAYLTLKQLCDSLELDIREKLCMTELPGMEKGTNKHTAEIIYKQEYAIDYLLNMKQAREEHYNQFFEKLATLLGGEAPVIELELNDITKSKLDLLEAAVEAENAKTTQVGMQKATEATGEENE